MIHCVSTLTFKFHLLLTTETRWFTITWVRESNICNMAYHATAWATTSDKPKPPVCTIVIFPEVLSAQ